MEDANGKVEPGAKVMTTIIGRDLVFISGTLEKGEEGVSMTEWPVPRKDNWAGGGQERVK